MIHGAYPMASEDRRGFLDYWPMDGEQTAFHKSQARIRVLLGGGGSGKSRALMWEASLEMLTGRRKGSLPVHGWAFRQAYTDNPYIDPIFEALWYGNEQFAPFIPRNLQLKLTGRKRVMPVKNGSTMTYRTWAQRWQAQMGQDPDFIMLDEESPGEIFRECRIRMLRKKSGFICVACTPLSDKPWITALLEEAEKKNGTVEVFYLDTEENIYLDAKQRDAMLDDLDELEREVRVKGKPRTLKGRVYQAWSPDNWRDQWELPKDRTDYCIIDLGIDNPTAALLVGITKPREVEVDGVKLELSDLWLHREFYRRGVTDITELVEGIVEVASGLIVAAWYLDPYSASQSVVSHRPDPGLLTVFDHWKEAGKKWGMVPQLMPRNQRDRVVTRFRLTDPWVNLNGSWNLPQPQAEHHDPKTVGDIFAIRGMRHLQREIGTYRIHGLMFSFDNVPETPQKRPFRGHNHLIYGMEMAVVMGLKYIPEVTADREEMSSGQKLSRDAWNAMGQFTPHGSVAQGLRLRDIVHVQEY